MRRNKKSLIRSLAETLAALGAVLFLLGTAPAAAAEPMFDACSQCYEGLGSLACAGLVNTTISNCCGGGGGWAWCVSQEWGFYVDCNSEVGTGECQCDYGGDNCDPHFRMLE